MSSLHTNRNITLVKANLLDARATTGNRNVVRRRRAVLQAARQSGYAAQSATQAAIRGLGSNADAATDPNQALREDLMEVREAIADDEWPAEVTVTNEQGQSAVVTLSSREDAEQLADTLEARLSPVGNLQHQQALAQQRRQYSSMSNVIKAHHDITNSMINNLRS